MKTLALAFMLLFSAPMAAMAAPVTGSIPSTVTISGENGGKTDGTAWSSESIKDKVWTVFYVDPDKKDINEKLEEAIKKQGFPEDKYGSIAIINMDATWLPNGIIASSLKSKQEKHPKTIYVKDLTKYLVKQWQLADDTYDVLVFDREGKLQYNKSGEFSDADIEKVLSVIKELIK